MCSLPPRFPDFLFGLDESDPKVSQNLLFHAKILCNLQCFGSQLTLSLQIFVKERRGQIYTRFGKEPWGYTDVLVVDCQKC